MLTGISFAQGERINDLILLIFLVLEWGLSFKQLNAENMPTSSLPPPTLDLTELSTQEYF